MRVPDQVDFYILVTLACPESDSGRTEFTLACLVFARMTASYKSQVAKALSYFLIAL